MNRCRIIRGIIVVAFIACLCLALFVSSNNIKEELKKLDVSSELIYLALILLAIIGYAFLKKKLQNSECNKKLEYIYRYIYLIVFILLTRFLATYLYKGEADLSLISPSKENGLASYLIYTFGKFTLRPLYAVIITNTIITTISMIFIKRIVFNVTTNEMLSAMTAILYIFLPKAIVNTTVYDKYSFNIMIILIAIYMLLKIIDEIKQHKLKNIKYINYTVIMGAFIVIDILLGGSIIFWSVLILVTALVSKDVDYLHISFKKEFVEKFSMKTRRFIYKVERMRISKFVTIFCILACFLVISGFLLYYFGQDVILEKYNDIEMENVISLLEDNFMIYKVYYLIVCALTIILEMLCFGLGRKQDTKSAILKFVFIAIMVLAVLSNNKQEEIVISTLLIINMVINLGNIYYNREEKIKLIKEKN